MTEWIKKYIQTHTYKWNMPQKRQNKTSLFLTIWMDLEVL